MTNFVNCPLRVIAQASLVSSLRDISVMTEDSTSDLPTKIDIGHVLVPVQLYIPNLFKCMRWQKSGNIKFNCGMNYICPCCVCSDHNGKVL